MISARLHQILSLPRAIGVSCLIVASCVTPSLLSGNEPASMPTVVVVKSSLQDSASSAPTHRLGFVLESEGFVLTTYDAVITASNSAIAPRIEVAFENGNAYPVSVVAVEPTLRLAILKIEAAQTFPASQIVGKNPLQPGQALYVATGFEGNSTQFKEGTLAGLNNQECYQADMTATMMRVEMPIPDSAIGGPVFDRNGEVIAIYTGYRPTALPGHVENARESHVLPIALALNIYQSLKFRKSFASPWTGFSVRSLSTEEQEVFPTGNGMKGGVGIEEIWPDSPADRLGIRKDDILVRFGFNPVESVGDFQKWLYLNGVGKKVNLVFLRNESEYRVVEYTIEERPDWAVPR